MSWRVKYDLHITILATVLLVAATTGWAVMMIEMYPDGNHHRPRSNRVSDPGNPVRTVVKAK